MSEIVNTYEAALTDDALVRTIGAFVRHHRLEQNKSQAQLAEEAGMNRSTLVALEQGQRTNLITLIQVLRALNQLHIINQFKVERQISPLLVAEMEHNYRKRASKKPDDGITPKSDW